MYKGYKDKSKEEIIYERYEANKDKSILKKDELYKVINKELSEYCYNYSPLTSLNIEILMNNIKEVETLLAKAIISGEIDPSRKYTVDVKGQKLYIK